MANNDIGVTDVAGGVPVASDDVAGIHYQRIKLVDGTEDGTTPIPGGTLGLLVNLTGMKAEDVASAGGDTGLPILVVRSDAGGTLVGTDNNYSMLQVDSSGRLRVVTAASYMEDDAAGAGDRGLFVLVQRHDADSSTVGTDGDYSALHVDALGRLKTANSVGTYLEDDAAVSADRGMFVLVMRHDADTSTVGTDGDYSGLHVDDKGRLKTVNRVTVVPIQQTPAISNAAIYAAKDAVGALLTFANAARVSGGSITVQSVQIADKGQQMAALDLVLFDRTFTAPTDNAIFAPTDAEVLTCRGVISFYASDYVDFSTNSVANKIVGLDMVLNGTDLFGVLVARGTPTYTSTSDIVVTVTVSQD